VLPIKTKTSFKSAGIKPGTQSPIQFSAAQIDTRINRLPARAATKIRPLVAGNHHRIGSLWLLRKTAISAALQAASAEPVQ
jgi:hypothetical protein